jgi:hypothetical protein
MTELTQPCLKEHQTGIGHTMLIRKTGVFTDVYDFNISEALTVARICAESQTFKFFGFFKQRNILNKSYFNTVKLLETVS